MKKITVTPEAFQRVKNAITKELADAHRRMKSNKEMISKLAKEQRTLKSEIGGIYAILRDLEGKPAKGAKRHNMKPD